MRRRWPAAWLAPWAYVASVIYHDSFWYPLRGRPRVQQVLRSKWGRLFQNFESVKADGAGYPDVGVGGPGLVRGMFKLIAMSLRILVTCLREAPELAVRRRRKG